MNKLKTFFMGLFFIFLYFFLSISMYLLLSKDIYNENIMNFAEKKEYYKIKKVVSIKTTFLFS